MSKRVLTNPKNRDIISKLSQKARHRKNLLKKPEKLFKKVLTSSQGCGIISKSPQKATAKWSLKIEQ